MGLARSRLEQKWSIPSVDMQANVRICGELFDCSKQKNYSEHKFGETLYTAGLRRYSLSANDILSDHIGYSVRQVSRVDCQAFGVNKPYATSEIP